MDYLSPGFQAVPAGGDVTDEPPRSQERILILVTADPSTAMLIRRGKRAAISTPARGLLRRGRSEPIGTATCFGTAPRRAEGFSACIRSAPAGRTRRAQDVGRRLNGVTHVPGQAIHRTLAGFRTKLVQQVVRLARDTKVIIVADRSRPLSRAVPQYSRRTPPCRTPTQFSLDRREYAAQ